MSTKSIITGIVIIIILYFNIMVITNKNEHIYLISVHTFRGDQTYTAVEYKVDSLTKGITFTDGFGLKRTINNNYSITQIK